MSFALAESFRLNRSLGDILFNRIFDIASGPNVFGKIYLPPGFVLIGEESWRLIFASFSSRLLIFGTVSISLCDLPRLMFFLLVPLQERPSLYAGKLLREFLLNLEATDKLDALMILCTSFILLSMTDY